MIVRTWHGCVPLQHAEGFARHLERTGVEHAQSIAVTWPLVVRTTAGVVCWICVTAESS